MFDPTIYENLKVVIEGAVYDQDLNGVIHVSAREDLVDLASLSRRYSISFHQKETSTEYPIIATIQLSAHILDLSSEILETADPDKELGCALNVLFRSPIDDVKVASSISEV
ncbi:MAG: hypothetical protein WD907_05525, partial [Bacilli bacterium]